MPREYRVQPQRNAFYGQGYTYFLISNHSQLICKHLDDGSLELIVSPLLCLLKHIPTRLERVDYAGIDPCTGTDVLNIVWHDMATQKDVSGPVHFPPGLYDFDISKMKTGFLWIPEFCAFNFPPGPNALTGGEMPAKGTIFTRRHGDCTGTLFYGSEYDHIETA